MTGPGGFPCWFLEPVMPCGHSHVALGLFRFLESKSTRGVLFHLGRVSATQGPRASQVTSPVYFLGFLISDFFPPLAPPPPVVPNLPGKHGNCPVGSDPVPGPEVLGRLQGPRCRYDGLKMPKILEPHILHSGPGSMRYQWALVSWFQDLPRIIWGKL